MPSDIKITWLYVGIVLLLYGLYKGSNAYKQYAEAKEEVRVEEEKLVSLQDSITALKLKPKAVEKERAELEVLKKSLRQQRSNVPTEINVTLAMKSIFAEVEKIGLKIISVSPKKDEVSSRFFSSLEIEYNMEGAFLQFLIFLDRISKLDHLIGVSRANMRLKNVKSKSRIGGSSTFSFAGKSVGRGKKYFHTISVQMALVLYRIL